MSALSLLCNLAQAQAPLETPEKSTDDAFMGATKSLLLQVILNGQSVSEIIRAEQLSDGRLVIPDTAWRAMRLRPLRESISMSENRIGYAVESIVGARYTVDMRNMVVLITVPPEAFDDVIVHPGLTDQMSPKPVSPGIYLNYDLSATRTNDATPYGALIEGIGFNHWGSGVLGLVLRDAKPTHEILRTETYWQTDLPNKMATLVLGDAITSAGSWSRPARYAGLRFSRDFSLQPGYITFPLPTITGSAALPSTVDLLINNQRIQSTAVSPGPFQLNNVPTITGAGDINLVVTDALGVQRVITQRYYASPRLLAPGLTDFSFELGALRENYLVQSSDYGAGFASGSYRYGISPALTAEGRLELQRQRQAAGVELAGLLGNIAVGRAALAQSSTDQGVGHRVVLGIERSSTGGAASLQWERLSAQFSPFAQVPTEIRPRERLVAGIGTRAPGNISLGFNYVDQSEWGGNRLQLASLNVGTTLAGNVFLGLYASQRLDKSDGWSGGLTLVVPLGGPNNATANTRRDNSGKVVNTAEVSQTTPFGSGVGWRIRASDAPAQRLQAGATFNTNVGRFTAEANEGDNNNALRLGASGSIGWFEGLGFATRNIGLGSFAVVQVGDLPGIPVYRNYQLAATTNDNGLAFVPGLLPYHRNQITVDPTELPFNVDIQGAEQTVMPYARSGTFVPFPIKRSRNALLTLLQSDNSPVPEGARVRTSASSEEFFVAREGEVYLKALGDKNEIDVRWAEGNCSVEFYLQKDSPIEPRLAPMLCLDRSEKK